MKMEPIEGSETSEFINQTPGNYPKGNLLYSVHGESLKSTIRSLRVMRFSRQCGWRFRSSGIWSCIIA